MPPARKQATPKSTSGNLRTVPCALKRIVPNPEHLAKIMDAVKRVNEAALYASELLNLHLRRMIASNCDDDELEVFFTANWLKKAFNEVTVCTEREGKPKIDPELRATRDAHMPAFTPVSRDGISACMGYACTNMRAVAENNVWMHFRKRVLAHVRTVWALDEKEYDALSKEQRRARSKGLLQMAADICRAPSWPRKSKEDSQHAWVDAERNRLGIDAAVGPGWTDVPLLFYLKKSPHRFVRAMALMAVEREMAERSSFSIYPLRRSFVPMHVKFCQEALRDVLKLGRSAWRLQPRAKRAKGDGAPSVPRPLHEEGAEPSTPSSDDEAAPAPAPAAPKKRKRTKAEMAPEKQALCLQVLDLRAGGVKRRHRFDFTFTTDGVCARLQMRNKSRPATRGRGRAAIPRRGLFTIEQLQKLGKIEDFLVIGIDPGKHELIVAVVIPDADDGDTKKCRIVRYTLKQRRHETGAAQYQKELLASKPPEVIAAETALGQFNSKTVSLNEFAAFCAKRRELQATLLAFYTQLEHRHRRWKTVIKSQQSEQALYNRLRALRASDDSRRIVLAYGSWGMVAGRAGNACNKGLPPTLGVGLMRKLARHFVVALTPEQYSTKTCCVCGHPCGPWKEKEAEKKKEEEAKAEAKERKEGDKPYKFRGIRGLRMCTNPNCGPKGGTPLNRDRNAAINIGRNFKRLFKGEEPIRHMTEEDLEFHEARLSLEGGSD
jgi:hypothetical protein